MILTTLVNLYKNIVKYDPYKGIFINGIDNAYPERVERTINNSVTARQSAALLQAFITGRGFEGLNEVAVNSKGTTLLQFLNEVAYSFSRQYGAFVHVNYNLNGDIVYLDSLPYSHCRIGKKDDNKYNGKILVSPDWNDRRKTPEVFDVYSPLKEVVLAQITKQGINKYKGQILFINPSPFEYPLSKVDPVILDADTEHQISIFKNASLRKGFFGKQIVITRPFADGAMENNPSYGDKITERNNFRDAMEKFLGAENVASFLHLEIPLDSFDLEKEIIFKNIDSNINDKLFAHSELTVSDNIRMAFNNIPAALIRSTDSSVFGQSGEYLKAMKLFYQEETEFERLLIESEISKLTLKYIGLQKKLTIKPLINVNITADNSAV